MSTPDQATEAQRAASYRASCVARKAYIQERAAALAPTAGADIAAGWRPLLDALGDQTGVCDDATPDSAQLGQLT